MFASYIMLWIERIEIAWIFHGPNSPWYGRTRCSQVNGPEKRKRGIFFKFFCLRQQLFFWLATVKTVEVREIGISCRKPLCSGQRRSIVSPSGKCCQFPFSVKFFTWFKFKTEPNFGSSRKSIVENYITKELTIT